MNVVGVNEVAVRQTPRTEMESPSWMSARMGEGGGVEMVRVVPVGVVVRDSTAVLVCQSIGLQNGPGVACLLPIASTMPVNILFFPLIFPLGYLELL